MLVPREGQGSRARPPLPGKLTQSGRAATRRARGRANDTVGAKLDTTAGARRRSAGLWRSSGVTLTHPPRSSHQYKGPHPGGGVALETGDNGPRLCDTLT
jgi:hypothetical protein